MDGRPPRFVEWERTCAPACWRATSCPGRGLRPVLAHGLRPRRQVPATRGRRGRRPGGVPPPRAALGLRPRPGTAAGLAGHHGPPPAVDHLRRTVVRDRAATRAAGAREPAPPPNPEEAAVAAAVAKRVRVAVDELPLPSAPPSSSPTSRATPSARSPSSPASPRAPPSPACASPCATSPPPPLRGPGRRVVRGPPPTAPAQRRSGGAGGPGPRRPSVQLPAGRVGGAAEQGPTRPAVVGTNGQAATPRASSNGSRRVSSRWASGSGRRQGSVAAEAAVDAAADGVDGVEARRSSARSRAAPTSARAAAASARSGPAAASGGRVGLAAEAAPQQGGHPVGRAGDRPSRPLVVSSATLSQASSTSAVSGPRAHRAWRSGSARPARCPPRSRGLRPQLADSLPPGRGVRGPPGWSPGDRVVVGDHLVGRAQALAGAEQDGRPPDGVEPDVVLADEVAVAGRGPLPPAPPGVRCKAQAGPLHRGRQVADDGVEPDVQAAVVPAGQGDRHAPVQVAGDRPRPQPGRQPRASAPTNGCQPAPWPSRRSTPAGAGRGGGTAGAGAAARPARRSAGSAARPAPRGRGCGRRCRTGRRGRPGRRRTGRSPPRSGRAGSGLAGAEGGRLGRLGDQPALVEAREQLLGDGVVPAGGRLGVVVEGDAGAGEAGRDALVLAVGQGRRRQPGPLGRDRDRGAVLVGPDTSRTRSPARR